MSKEFLLRKVLDNRFSDESELTLHAFDRCNLNCSFCFMDVKNKKGVRDILNKLPAFEEWAKVEDRKKVVVNIMGGEIFDPEIFDEEQFDLYVKLAHGIVNAYKPYQISVRLNWVSNLVVDINFVLKLIYELRRASIECTITTSYDSKGRFNKKTKEIWMNNLKKLVELGENPYVSMLFTKPVIKELISKGDETFDWLYKEGLPIYIDYYTPTTGYGGNDALLQANMPSDVDLLKAFVYLIDNYPKVQPINGMLTFEDSGLSCRKSKLILPDGSRCLCGNLHLEDPIVVFYKSKIQKINNDEIEERFIKERDCLSCEHFKYCQMGCFMQHDFSKRTQLKDCLFKLTYDYARDRRPIDYSSLETFFGKKEIDI